MPQNRRHLLKTLAFAACCLVGFDLFRPAAPDTDYVFAMSIEGPDGAVLASPVVLGASGRKVEVRMMCENDPRLERMSLVLEPVSDPDGGLAYLYDLSVAGDVQHAKGRVTLQKGAEQRIAVKPDPGSRGLTLALYAAPLRHPGLERYLKARRERLGRTST